MWNTVMEKSTSFLSVLNKVDNETLEHCCGCKWSLLIRSQTRSQPLQNCSENAPALFSSFPQRTSRSIAHGWQRHTCCDDNTHLTHLREDRKQSRKYERVSLLKWPFVLKTSFLDLTKKHEFKDPLMYVMSKTTWFIHSLNDVNVNKCWKLGKTHSFFIPDTIRVPGSVGHNACGN